MKRFSIHQVWFVFFGIWFVLLSGVLDFWLHTPGLKQWASVESSLLDKRHEIDKIEVRSNLLKTIAIQLESNPSAQEREIRKVLGYLGENEVVFEF